MTMNESTELNERKRVLGIWDLDASSVSLGGLLILVAELRMQCMIHGADFADICFIGNATHLLPVRGIQADGDAVTLLDGKACRDSALLSALFGMEGIASCCLCRTFPALGDFLRESPYQYVIWPALSDQGLVDHRYASTMFAQKFYRENGFVPYLACKTEPIRWAVHFIKRCVIPYLPVVVHLKNNPNEQRRSNADFDAWLGFFEACHLQYDVRFILIGNEEIDQRILRLPNTLKARDYGSNLSRDLALIQASFIFMGMGSGPCNMAVFSKTPYVIYKNPDHHAEQMTLELGKTDQFPFATPFQKVLRVFETTESLISEFAHLYTHGTRQEWQKQLANLERTLA